MSETPILFEVVTPLGFKVRTTRSYWDKIVFKHPDLSNRLEDIKQTLAKPQLIRRSSHDENIMLFYQHGIKRWVVAVARKVNQAEGFLVTAYRTDAMKEGEIVWPK